RRSSSTGRLAKWAFAVRGFCCSAVRLRARALLLLGSCHSPCQSVQGLRTSKCAGGVKGSLRRLPAVVAPLLPNKRLKLTGGDCFKGNGVLCPWRGREEVPREGGGGRGARRRSENG